MAAIPFQRDIDYPESDGRPLGETDRHRQEIVDLLYGLQQHYAGDPGVYVAGNLFLYYAEGNRNAAVCPDVFVVKGAGKELRRTFKVWEEGDRRPCLVIEVTSESTRDEDLIEKKGKYARLGVEEYFLLDPLGEYLSPPLQGFRLRGSRYFGVPLEPDGSLRSETTGLLLRREGGRSRLVDAATGESLPRVDELAGLRQAAEDRAAGEAAARRAAETRAARAETRAVEEAAARKAAEEDLADLRRQLAQRRPAD